MDKENVKCELCRREVRKDQMGWSGSFALCKKCLDYLKRKGK